MVLIFGRNFVLVGRGPYILGGYNRDFTVYFKNLIYNKFSRHDSPKGPPNYENCFKSSPIELGNRVTNICIAFAVMHLSLISLTVNNDVDTYYYQYCRFLTPLYAYKLCLCSRFVVDPTLGIGHIFLPPPTPWAASGSEEKCV